MEFNLTGIDVDAFIAANSSIFVGIVFVIVVPSLILSVLCVVALLLAHTLNWPIRVALINIFAAEMCYWVALCILLLGYPTRARNPEGETISCRVYISFFTCAAHLKFTSVTLYAIMVYIFIKYGVRKLKTSAVIPSVIALWIVSILLSISSYIPGFLAIVNGNGFCIGQTMSNARAVFLIIFLLPMIVSCCTIIVFCVLTYCYMRRNTLEDNVEVKRAIAKNLLYLLIAALFGFLYNIAPAFFGIIMEPLRDHGVVAFVMINYFGRVFSFLTSVATPIVAIAIIKPVRVAMKGFITKCACCKKNNEEE